MTTMWAEWCEPILWAAMFTVASVIVFRLVDCVGDWIEGE